MTLLEEFFCSVVADLERIAIPYMVVGSLAGSAHGHPRSTNDADIVISPTAAQLAVFIDGLGKDIYADLNMANRAMQLQSMFNIINPRTGAKIDFIALKSSAFEQLKFSRRMRTQIADVVVWASTPEDTILSKLEWSKMGDSERQYRDAMNIAAAQKANLDVPYLCHWGVELGVSSLVDKLLLESGLADSTPDDTPD